jgi:hypothetical protein
MTTHTEAPDVQELADAAVCSGCTAQDVQALAAIGSHGHNPQNMQRDLLRKFGYSMTTPDVTTVSTPYLDKVGERTTVEMCDTDLLLPHDWFASLANSPEAEEHVLGLNARQAFWAKVRQDDPRKDRQRLSENMVPLVVHGDAAAFQQRDSLMAISMRSLLTKGSVVATQLLLAALPKSCTVSAKRERLPEQSDSWRAIWKQLVWSFKALYEGGHPVTDADGLPHAAGSYRAEMAGKPLTPQRLRAVVWVLAGDMEYLQNELGLPHHATDNPCWLCRCDKGTRSFVDFRKNAAWRATILSAEEHRQRPPTNHPVMAIPGVSAYSFAIDTLHVMELGITSHALGKFLFLLCQEYPGSRAQSVDALRARIQELSDELGSPSRFSRFDFGTFATPAALHQNYPQIGGGIKARETRYLAPRGTASVRGEERWFAEASSQGVDAASPEPSVRAHRRFPYLPV